ncbi:hypothetical protein M422DRAFT_251376 [Sphaerobolus stellatus SS14]|uniref:Uncharacterized protein n=1 Tax=Sphaerobolus stellatus (strain SS14) TaxID=990650 RepID=A0A0C9W2E5_SPHS4|nr:hypothetical protein M422DRAFT_251376 [Sphaerobolus stellatus SS14]
MSRFLLVVDDLQVSEIGTTLNCIQWFSPNYGWGSNVDHWLFRLENSKQAHNVFGNKRSSLLIVFLRQGVIRFIIIFLWLLVDAVLEKVLSIHWTGIDISLEESVSVILACRFLLELRKFDKSLQGIPTDLNIVETTQARTGFLGCLHRLNETIVEEFGNVDLYYEFENDSNEVEDQEGFPLSEGVDTELRITAEEYPRAII